MFWLNLTNSFWRWVIFLLAKFNPVSKPVQMFSYYKQIQTVLLICIVWIRFCCAITFYLRNGTKFNALALNFDACQMKSVSSIRHINICACEFDLSHFTCNKYTVINQIMLECTAPLSNVWFFYLTTIGDVANWKRYQQLDEILIFFFYPHYIGEISKKTLLMQYARET